MRIADRFMLRDHALKHRRLFLRPSMFARMRRWLRANSFGVL